MIRNWQRHQITLGSDGWVGGSLVEVVIGRTIKLNAKTNEQSARIHCAYPPHYQTVAKRTEYGKWGRTKQLSIGNSINQIGAALGSWHGSVMIHILVHTI